MNAEQHSRDQSHPEQMVKSLVLQIADEAELLSLLQAAFPQASVLRATVIPFAIPFVYKRRDVLVTIEAPACSLSETYSLKL